MGVHARIRHERYLNRQTLLNGETNCVTMAPGQELKVTGGEEVTDLPSGRSDWWDPQPPAATAALKRPFTRFPIQKTTASRPEPGD